jgi:Enolase C-terminal domain-like
VRVLDEGSLYWIEEPTRTDDFAGHARIAQEARTPICIGENWWGPHEVAKSLEAGACDYGMLDAMKIGGVTGWPRAAALAESSGLPLTSHVFPEISTTCWPSVRLPTGWSTSTTRVLSSRSRSGSRTGTLSCLKGLEWDEEAIGRYLYTPEHEKELLNRSHQR